MSALQVGVDQLNRQECVQAVVDLGLGMDAFGSTADVAGVVDVLLSHG
jgi:hypothetical protein